MMKRKRVFSFHSKTVIEIIFLKIFINCAANRVFIIAGSAGYLLNKLLKPSKLTLKYLISSAL